MHRLSLLKFVAVLFQILGAASHLLVTPEDVTVENGGRVSFNCCTNLDEGIRWMYATEENSEMQDHIYSGGFTYPQWRMRHNVTESATAFFTLTIEPVVPTDAGFYSCMDIKDDSYYEAKLVVIHIHEWTTTDSLSDLHTSQHSMIYKRSSEHVIVGIVVFCLLITSCMMVALMMVALCQRKFFKSGKLFGSETHNENHPVIVCALPIHIKDLLALYFNCKRNSSDNFEATNWHTIAKEKCTTRNEEEVTYMITK